MKLDTHRVQDCARYICLIRHGLVETIQDEIVHGIQSVCHSLNLENSFNEVRFPVLKPLSHNKPNRKDCVISLSLVGQRPIEGCYAQCREKITSEEDKRYATSIPPMPEYSPSEQPVVEPDSRPLTTTSKFLILPIPMTLGISTTGQTTDHLHLYVLFHTRQ